MVNIKLTIEYDGSNYHGWQRQNNAVSIQETIEKAIYELTGEEITITGASRTDFGVHAYGQTANFTTSSRIPPERFSYALNRILPNDIVIKKSEEVSMDFHSRYSAKGKKYRYLVYNSNFPSALLRNRAFHVSHFLCADKMKKAAECLVGTHDFSAFKASGSSVKTSVRTITEVSVSKNEDILSFEISGDGFLYNMVRIIVGTLVDVGTGKIEPWEMEKILKGRDRRKAGRTAPSCGLYLVEVYY